MPPRPSRYFTGREELLEELAGLLQPPPDGPPAVVALHGLAGVGKTEVARAYCHRYGDRYGDRVEWVQAGSGRLLAAGYARVAERRRLPGPRRDPRDRVRGWLEAEREWLLVLDGVPEPGVLEGYLPGASAGSVLITSPYAAWKGRGWALGVEPLDRPASVRFLLTRTGQTGATAAAAVADELGDLPLALEEVAAACVREQVPLGRYAHRLREDLEATLALGSPGRSRRTLAGALASSLQAARRFSPAAYDLLRVLSFLAPAKLERDADLGHVGRLLDAAGSPRRAAGAGLVNELLADLRRLSLIQTDQTGRVSVHRLVQAAVRASMPSEERRRWAGAAVRLVAAAFPVRVERRDQWPACERLAAHALAAAAHAWALGCELRRAAELRDRVNRYRRWRR